jgi:hypothetical protein
LRRNPRKHLFRDRFLLVNRLGGQGSSPTLDGVIRPRAAALIALVAVVGALVLGLTPEVTGAFASEAPDAGVEQVVSLLTGDALDEAVGRAPQVPSPPAPLLLAVVLAVAAAAAVLPAGARVAAEERTPVLAPVRGGSVGRRAPPRPVGTRLT